jgi:hypothetical protein
MDPTKVQDSILEVTGSNRNYWVILREDTFALIEGTLISHIYTSDKLLDIDSYNKNGSKMIYHMHSL